jgi:hypothetical protein
MGAPELTAWGAQYVEGNPYAMVNIPVSGALHVAYGIVDGGTFALFLDTTQPVELEIGLMNGDVLDWACVTYAEGGTFAGTPPNIEPDVKGFWTHYQRKETDPDTGEEEILAWWPPGAGFVFGGATQRQCVIENRMVVVAGVSGPFPKPQPTAAPAAPAAPAPNDADGDGVADAVDNCPTVANPQQMATDDDTPTCRFIDNNDGTVTDMNTALMWEQTPTNGSSLWCAALNVCANLVKGGYSDWRLASLTEWQGLTGGTCNTCGDWVLPAGHPFSAVQWGYWTPRV